MRLSSAKESGHACMFESRSLDLIVSSESAAAAFMFLQSFPLFLPRLEKMGTDFEDVAFGQRAAKSAKLQ